MPTLFPLLLFWLRFVAFWLLSSFLETGIWKFRWCHGHIWRAHLFSILLGNGHHHGPYWHRSRSHVLRFGISFIPLSRTYGDGVPSDVATLALEQLRKWHASSSSRLKRNQARTRRVFPLFSLIFGLGWSIFVVIFFLIFSSGMSVFLPQRATTIKTNKKRKGAKTKGSSVTQKNLAHKEMGRIFRDRLFLFLRRRRGLPTKRSPSFIFRRRVVLFGKWWCGGEELFANGTNYLATTKKGKERPKKREEEKKGTTRLVLSLYSNPTR